MATFNITVVGSSVTGTAANDTFNIQNGAVSALGLDGDDTFRFVTGGGFAFLFLDGGAGNDSFNFDVTSSNDMRGGDGNDQLFIGRGDRNILGGGTGNDWLGIGANNFSGGEHTRRR